MILSTKPVGALNKPLLSSIMDSIGAWLSANMGKESGREYLPLAEITTFLPIIDAQKKMKTMRYKMTGIAMANTPTIRQSPVKPGVMRETYQLPVVISIFYDYGIASERNSEIYDAFLDTPAILRFYDGADFGVMRVQVLNQQMSPMDGQMEKMDMVYQVNLLIHGFLDYSTTTREVIFDMSIEQIDIFGGPHEPSVIGVGGSGGGGVSGTGSVAAPLVSSTLNNVFVKTDGEDAKDLISISNFTVALDSQSEEPRLVISSIDSLSFMNTTWQFSDPITADEMNLITITPIFVPVIRENSQELLLIWESLAIDWSNTHSVDKYEANLISFTEELWMIEDTQEFDLITSSIRNDILTHDEELLPTYVTAIDWIGTTNTESSLVKDLSKNEEFSSRYAVYVNHSGIPYRNALGVTVFKTGGDAAFILRPQGSRRKLEVLLVKTTYNNNAIMGAFSNPLNTIKDKSDRPGIFVYWAKESENGN